MDLPESLRALYFAPLPLVVLTSNRTIKMLNQSAEIVFRTCTQRCIGESLERFLDPTSLQPFQSCINDAYKTATAFPLGMAHPVSTRLQLQPIERQDVGVWADFTISAWFQTDAIPDSIVKASSSSTATSDSAKHSNDSIEYLSSSVRAPHEALYTISIIPSTIADVPASASLESKQGLTYALQESVLQNLDVALVALSKDGKTEIRNRACIQLATSLQEGSGADDMQDGILPYAESTFTFYDEDFINQLAETDWPIYKSAFLGQSTSPTIMGIEINTTGKRLVVEVVATAIRNYAGYGEHIGGFATIKNVTAERERIKQESELKRNLNFRQTVETMPQLLWQASPVGYVNWFSNSFLQYTGLSNEQMEGAGWAVTFHEEDLVVVGKVWSDSIRSGEPFDCAFRIRRHDGVYRWFLCRASPLKDPTTNEVLKWFGTNTDVHDQVEALSSSQRSQMHLQKVINYTGVTLWAADREGIITLAEGPAVRQKKLAMDKSMERNNDNGEEISESMIGRSVYDIWVLEDSREYLNKALQGETVFSEVEINGRWHRVSYSPLREQEKDVHPLYNGTFDQNAFVNTEIGDIVGVVGVSMDVTELKRAEERMEESTIEKTRALAAEGAAREASRLKSQFLANMSHEIRTPIAGIIGLCELLLDEKGLTPQHREYAETIERSAEGLLTVINDVLDFSKVEIGKMDVEQIPFNLAVLLGDLKRMLSFAASKKGLQFKESINLAYKGYLIGDLGRLRQVITNLLTNAIKFTSQGHVSLEVSEQSEDENGVLIRFDVEDTGCGIQTDALSQLFKPFSQADASTARRFGGTGLGLSISKNLVELMGGEIGLMSIEGKGTHAWFAIPFRRASVMEEPSETLVANASLPENSFGLASGGMPITVTTSLSRPRKDIWVLVAEDNVVNARIALRNIEKMGFSCQLAENGLIALEELRQRRYDVVLMDCQMPDCDGYEATRRIRKSPNVEIRTLPIIALTASAIKGDRERALDAGMVDYLAKPVKRPELENTLCKWLYDYNARQKLAEFLNPTDQKTTEESYQFVDDLPRKRLHGSF